MARRKLLPLGRALSVGLVCLACCGCSTWVQRWLYGISEGEAERQLRVYAPRIDPEKRALLPSAGMGGDGELKLSIRVPDGFREYLRDVKARSDTGSDPEVDPAESALSVLEDPTVTGILGASDYVLAAAEGRAVPAEQGRISTSLEDWLVLNRRLEDSILVDGWTALQVKSAAYAKTVDESDPDYADVQGVAVYAHYVREYFLAYFRGAALIEVEVNLVELTKRLRQKIEDRLESTGVTGTELEEKVKLILREELLARLVGLLPAQHQDKVQKIAADLVETGTATIEIGSRLVRGTESDPSGFTSRAGDNHRWPAVQLTLDPAADQVLAWGEIDATAIGSQLVRVFLEAVFDARFRVPGTDKATGVAFTGKMRLPKFEDGLEGVTTEEFDRINDWAGNVEGVASSAVGRLVRGIGWISLNNESLAALIETTVGVMARKLTEVGLWVRFSDAALGADKAGDATFSASTGLFVPLDFRFQSLSRPPDR